MSKKNNKYEDLVSADSVEEIRESLKYAIESRSWLDAEETLELLNDLLGYETEEDSDASNLEE